LLKAPSGRTDGRSARENKRQSPVYRQTRREVGTQSHRGF
jgi:hypothetical protein